MINEGGDGRLRHQRIIRRNTNLARHGDLTVGDSQRRIRDRVIVGDNSRGFSAQLESDGNEVFGRCRHHQPPDPGAAGKNHVIERQRGETGRVGCLLAEDSHFAVVEDLSQHGLYDGVGAWRLFWQLDHGPVTRRDGCDQRANGEIERHIPRSDDPDHALRLIGHLEPVGPGKQRLWGALLRLHPLLHMAPRMVEHPQRADDLDQPAFKVWPAAEILAGSIGKNILIAFQLATQGPELCHPLVRRARCRQRCPLQAFEFLKHCRHRYSPAGFAPRQSALPWPRVARLPSRSSAP